jgi:uncharacterized lipoprotein NlpE involved in copper resistance
MRSSVRIPCLVAVAVSLAAVGCESNNKGKLEGTKWSASLKEVPGATMSLEFAADGNLRMVIQAAGKSKTITGKWRLSFGDYVDMTDLSEALANSTNHHEKITIEGSSLTMTDSDGKAVTFRKVETVATKAEAEGGWNR